MEENKPNNNGTSMLIAGIVIVLCCICVIVAGLGGYLFYGFSTIAGTDVFAVTPVGDDTPVPGDTSDLFRPPLDTISAETIQALDESVVPENDVYELACRMQGKCNVP